jgi:hypothetical protein
MSTLVSVTGAVKIDIFVKDEGAKEATANQLAEQVEAACNVTVFPTRCCFSDDDSIPSVYVLVLCGTMYADTLVQAKEQINQLFPVIKNSGKAFVLECAIRMYDFNSEMVETIIKGETDNVENSDSN